MSLAIEPLHCLPRGDTLRSAPGAATGTEPTIDSVVVIITRT
jgi:hypothetical protein